MKFEYLTSSIILLDQNWVLCDFVRKICWFGKTHYRFFEFFWRGCRKKQNTFLKRLYYCILEWIRLKNVDFKVRHMRKLKFKQTIKNSFINVLIINILLIFIIIFLYNNYLRYYIRERLYFGTFSIVKYFPSHNHTIFCSYQSLFLLISTPYL